MDSFSLHNNTHTQSVVQIHSHGRLRSSIRGNSQDAASTKTYDQSLVAYINDRHLDINSGEDRQFTRMMDGKLTTIKVATNGPIKQLSMRTADSLLERTEKKVTDIDKKGNTFAVTLRQSSLSNHFESNIPTHPKLEKFGGKRKSNKERKEFLATSSMIEHEYKEQIKAIHQYHRLEKCRIKAANEWTLLYDINQTYRRLALLFHSDKIEDAGELMLLLNDAKDAGDEQTIKNLAVKYQNWGSTQLAEKIVAREKFSTTRNASREKSNNVNTVKVAKQPQRNQKKSRGWFGKPVFERKTKVTTESQLRGTRCGTGAILGWLPPPALYASIPETKCCHKHKRFTLFYQDAVPATATKKSTHKFRRQVQQKRYARMIAIVRKNEGFFSKYNIFDKNQVRVSKKREHLAKLGDGTKTSLNKYLRKYKRRVLLNESAEKSFDVQAFNSARRRMNEICERMGKRGLELERQPEIEACHEDVQNEEFKQDEPEHIEDNTTTLKVGGIGDCWTILPVFEAINIEDDEIMKAPVFERLSRTGELDESSSTGSESECSDIDEDEARSECSSSDGDSEESSNYDDEDSDEEGLEYDPRLRLRLTVEDEEYILNPNEPISAEMLAFSLDQLVTWMANNPVPLHLRMKHWRVIVQGDHMLHLENAMQKYDLTDDTEFVTLKELYHDLIDLIKFHAERGTLYNDDSEEEDDDDSQSDDSSNSDVDECEEKEQIESEKPTLQVGAIFNFDNPTSVAHAVGLAHVPPTSTWNALVDSHDLRELALRLAQVDHQVYGIPGTGHGLNLQKLTNPAEGGIGLGMNITFTNEMSPDSWIMAIPEATAVHLSRQIFGLEVTKIYGKPDWIKIEDYLRCSDKGKHAILFGTNVSINKANLTLLLSGTSECTVLVPNYHGLMAPWISANDGNTEIRRTGGSVEVIHSCSTKVMEHELAVLTGLQTCDYILSKQIAYRRTHLGNVEGYSIVHLARTDISDEEITSQITLNFDSTVKTYEFVMPKKDAIFGEWIPAFERVKVEIDHELLRTMYAHNLRGADLDFKTLITRAIGYAHRRYHVKQNILQRTNHTTDSLLHHALIASAMVKRSYTDRVTTLNMLNAKGWQPRLQRSMYSAGELILKELTKTKYGGTVQKWSKKLSKYGDLTISDFTNQAVFNEMDAWLFEGKAKNCEFFLLDSDADSSNCLCHTPGCNHSGRDSCTHCGLPSVGMYCTCCNKEFCSTTHSCEHSCNGIHEGEEVCNCCGKPSSTERCSHCLEHKDDLNMEFEYEWDEFASKVEHAGGKPGKPHDVNRPSQGSTAHKQKFVYAGKNYILHESWKNADKKLFACCPKCSTYFIGEFKFKEPVYVEEDACPGCGTKKLPKYKICDDAGVIPKITKPASENEGTEDAGSDKGSEAGDETEEALPSFGSSSNGLALISHGYTVSELKQLAGDLDAFKQKWEEVSEMAFHHPMLPWGVTTIAVETTDMQQLVDTTSGETCGFECLNDISPALTLNQCHNITGKREWFNTMDMIQICEKCEINCMLVFEKEVRVCKFNDSGYYTLILATSDAHWAIGKANIDFKEVPALTKLNGITHDQIIKARELANTGSDTRTQINFAAELSFVGKRDIESNIFPLREVDGFLTNNKNKVNRPTLGLYSFKLPDEFSNVHELCVGGANEYNKYIKAPWTRTQRTDVKNECKMRALNAAHTICAANLMGVVKLDGHSGTKIVLSNRHADGSVMITLPIEGKWQKGDILRIYGNNYSGIHAINPEMEDGKWYARVFLPSSLTTANCEFIKGSYINSVKTILTCAKLFPSLPDGNVGRINVKTVIGVPGSGKSTHISNRASRGDLIVVCTNGNKRSMIKKNQSKKAKERATIVNVSDMMMLAQMGTKYNHIYLDECTMMSALEYFAARRMVKSDDKILAFGDNSQIGVTTFTNFAPNQEVTPLHGHVHADDIEEWLTSHRLPKRFAKIARHATGKEVVTDREEEGQIECYNSGDIGAAVSDICANHNIDIVLCFTRKGQIAASKALKDKVQVMRVHGVQGGEWDSVLIVQERTTANDLTSRDPKKTYSAFTRAKQSVHWLTIGGTANETIEQRVGSIKDVDAYVGDAMKFLKHLSFNKKNKIAVPMVEADEILSEFNQSIKEVNKHTIPNGVRQQITHYAQKLHGANVTFEDGKNSTDISFHKMGMIALTLSWTGTEVQVIHDKFKVMSSEKVEKFMKLLSQEIKPDNTVYNTIVQLPNWCVTMLDVLSELATEMNGLGTTLQITTDNYKMNILNAPTENGMCMELDLGHDGLIKLIDAKSGDKYVTTTDETTLMTILLEVRIWIKRIMKMKLTDLRWALRIRSIIKTKNEITLMIGSKLGLSADTIARIEQSEIDKARFRCLAACKFKYKVLEAISPVGSFDAFQAEEKAGGKRGWIVQSKFVSIDDSSSLTILCLQSLADGINSRWYGRMIGKVRKYRAKFAGAMGPNIKPWDQHVAEETATFKYLSNKVGSLKAKMLKFDNKPIGLVPNSAEAWQELVEMTMSNCGFHFVSVPSTMNANWTNATQVCQRMLPIHLRSRVLCLEADAVIKSTNYKGVSIRPEWSPQSAIWDSSFGKYLNICKRLTETNTKGMSSDSARENLEKVKEAAELAISGDDVWAGKLNPNDETPLTIIGNAMPSANPEAWWDALKLSCAKRRTMLVVPAPMVHNPAGSWQKMNEMWTALINKKYELVCQVPNNFADFLEKGSIEFKESKIQCSMICRNEAIWIFEIKIGSEPTKYASPIEMCHDLFSTVELPILNTSIVDMIAQGNIVKKRKCTIDKRLVRNLRLRAMRPGTTYDDLLMAARTMLHAVIYSPTKWTFRNTSDASILMDSAFAAYTLSTKLVENMSAAARLYSSNHDGSHIAQTVSRLKSISSGLTAEAMSVLGLNMNETELENVLKSSSSGTARWVAEDLARWRIKIDDHFRRIWRPDRLEENYQRKAMPPIAQFALSNFLHWDALSTPLQTLANVHHIGMTPENTSDVFEIIRTLKPWWVTEPAIAIRLDEVLEAHFKGVTHKSLRDKNRQNALKRFLNDRDAAAIMAFFTAPTEQKLDPNGTNEEFKFVSRLTGVNLSRLLRKDDVTCAANLTNLKLKNPAIILNHDETKILKQIRPDANNSSHAEWNLYWREWSFIMAKYGMTFKPRASASRDMHDMTIIITAIGSRGDIRPAHNLALQLAIDGARVYLLHPSGMLKELSSKITYLQGSYDVDKELEKWHKIMNLDEDFIEIIMKDDLNNNWLQNVNYKALPKEADLIIGSPVTPMGLMLAHAFGCDYVDFCPMPLDQIEGGKISKLYKRLVVKEYILLHAQIMKADFEKITNRKLSIDAVLRTPRCYWQATDPMLEKVASGEYIACNVGYWGKTNIYETKTTLGNHKNTLFVTMGSMLSEQHVLAIAKLLKNDESLGDYEKLICIAKKNSKLAEECDQLNFEILSDDVDLSTIDKTCTVVHHGGAGTTSDISISGAWQVIVPVAFDQKKWGNKVTELNIGKMIQMSEINSAKFSFNGALKHNVGNSTRLQVDPNDNRPELIDTMTRFTGLTYSWKKNHSIFVKEETGSSWPELIEGVATTMECGRFSANSDGQFITTYDPAGMFEGEEKTCVLRTLNHYACQTEESLKLALAAIDLTIIEVDARGMSQTQCIALCLQLGMNLEMYTSSTCTKIVIHPKYTTAYIWWKDEAHVTACEMKNLSWKRSLAPALNLNMPELPSIIDHETGENYVNWNWQHGSNSGTHLGLNQAEFVLAMKTILSGGTVEIGRVKEYAPHVHRLIRDAFKSNMIRFRRGSIEWMTSASIKSTNFGSLYGRVIPVGKLVAMHCIDNSVVFGACVNNLQSGESVIIHPLPNAQVSGLIAHGGANLTQFISGNTDNFVQKRSWLKQTNVLLGKSYPTESGSTNDSFVKRSQYLLVGYHDGYIHHWNMQVLNAYEDDAILYGSEEEPDTEFTRLLKKDDSWLRANVYGEHKRIGFILTNIPEKSGVLEAIADKYNMQTGEFGLIYEDYENCTITEETLAEHCEPAWNSKFKLKWKMDTKWLNKRPVNLRMQDFLNQHGVEVELNDNAWLEPDMEGGDFEEWGLWWKCYTTKGVRKLSLEEVSQIEYLIIYDGHETSPSCDGDIVCIRKTDPRNGLNWTDCSYEDICLAVHSENPQGYSVTRCNTLADANTIRELPYATSDSYTNLQIGPGLGDGSSWRWINGVLNFNEQPMEYGDFRLDPQYAQHLNNKFVNQSMCKLADHIPWAAELDEIETKFGTSAFILDTDVVPFTDGKHNGGYIVQEDGILTYAGKLSPAEYNLSTAENLQVTACPERGTGHSTTKIKYRPEETGEFRNDSGNGIHFVNYPDEDKLSHSGDTEDSLQNLCDLIVRLAEGKDRVVITANADWNPENTYSTDKLGKIAFINLTYKSRPQKGWVNVVAPAVNKYETSLRQLRTILWYMANDSDTLVTVVGGREDFTEVAKGLKADLPKTHGVIKHIKTVGPAQVYLNNATGHMGCMNHYRDKFLNDMESRAQHYGTDEYLLCKYANNTIRLTKVDDSLEPIMPWASWPINAVASFLGVPWMSRSDVNEIFDMMEANGWERTEDNAAICCKLKRFNLNDKVVGHKNEEFTPELAAKMTNKYVVIDGEQIEVYTKGLQFNETRSGYGNAKVGAFDFIVPSKPELIDSIIVYANPYTKKIEWQGEHVCVGFNHPDKSITRLSMDLPNRDSVALASFVVAATYAKNGLWINKITSTRIIEQDISGFGTRGIVVKQIEKDVVKFRNNLNRGPTSIKGNAGMGDHNSPNVLLDKYGKLVTYSRRLTSDWPRGKGHDGPAWKRPYSQEWMSFGIDLPFKESAKPGPFRSLWSAQSGALTHKELITSLTAMADELPERAKQQAMCEIYGPKPTMSGWKLNADNVLPNLSELTVTNWEFYNDEETALDKNDGLDKCMICMHSYDRVAKRNWIYLRPWGRWIREVFGSDMITKSDTARLEEDGNDDGAWFEGQDETGKGKTFGAYDRKLGPAGTSRLDTFRGKTHESNEEELLPWAIGMTEMEMLALKDNVKLPKEVVFIDDYLDKTFKKAVENGDPNQVRGSLKVASRKVEPGKLLITFGPKCVDKKKFVYYKSLVGSGPAGTAANQAHRENLIMSESHVEVQTYYTFLELEVKIRDALTEMKSRRITTHTWLVGSQPVEEFVFNQVNEGFGYNVGSENSAASKMAPLIVNMGHMKDEIEGFSQGSRELVSDEVILMYENEDLTDNVRINAPLNRGEGKGFISTGMPLHVSLMKKYALCEYPVESRPQLTLRAYSMENTVFNVLGSRIDYRKENLITRSEVQAFIKSYGGENSQQQLKAWRENRIMYDASLVQEWLTGRSGIAEIDREMSEILASGITTERINQLNVHLKMESRVKPTDSFLQQENRIIVWQQKGYAALFSPVFLQAKARLKEFLCSKVLYADGCTPQQLSQRVANVQCTGFLEDDLTKQDRQTDDQTLDCEMAIYESVLGVHPDVVQLWRSAHEHWFFKGATVKGQLNAMRHTGQATTAIGNVLVNLLVHRKWYDDLGSDLKLMMVLGDDNIMLTNRFVNARQMRVDIRNRWNMESKAEYREIGGVFLRMWVSKGPLGNCQVGPDIVRLRQRFEFTNGTSEANEENLIARSLSYGFMLGQQANAKEFKDSLPLEFQSIEFPTYYDSATNNESLGDYYFEHLPTEHRRLAVENQRNLLLEMMSTRKVIEMKYFAFATNPQSRPVG